MNLSQYIEFLSKVQPAFGMQSVILITGAEHDNLTTYFDDYGPNSVAVFRTSMSLNEYAVSQHVPDYLKPRIKGESGSALIDFVAVVQLEEEDVSDETYKFIEDATRLARIRWAPFNVVTCEHFSHVEGQEPDFFIDYRWVTELSPEILLNGVPTQIYPQCVYNIDDKLFRPFVVFTLKNSLTEYVLPVNEIMCQTSGWDYPDVAGLGSYKDYE